MTPFLSNLARRQSARLVARSHRSAYTLIEMLVVLGIIAVIAGTSWSVLKIGEGSAVDSAASHVGGQLRLARQYAVSNREYVALLMPNSANAIASTVTDGSERSKFANGSVRACIVTPKVGGFTFVRYIDRDQWTFLSSRVEIKSDYNSYMTVDDVPLIVAADNVDGVRAVVFRATGQVYYTAASQTVTIRRRGTVTADNVVDIQVNWVTGKIKYNSP